MSRIKLFLVALVATLTFGVVSAAPSHALGWQSAYWQCIYDTKADAAAGGTTAGVYHPYSTPYNGYKLDFYQQDYNTSSIKIMWNNDTPGTTPAQWQADWAIGTIYNCTYTGSDSPNPLSGVANKSFSYWSPTGQGRITDGSFTYPWGKFFP